jgi:hypothetical protein
VPLISAQVLVTELVDRQLVAVRSEKSEQLANLGVISADRVRAAVGLELKPTEIFECCGLEIECHGEADCMLA